MTDVAYFDGACEPTNPGGTGGWGFVIYDSAGNKLAADSGSMPARADMTNNLAEYVAARRAIGAYGMLGRPGPLEMRGDSKLVIEQMSGNWRIKAGAYVHAAKDLRQFAREMGTAGIAITWQWIPRERNTEADDLSKAKLREAGVAIVLERPAKGHGPIQHQLAIEGYQRKIEALEDMLASARLLLRSAVDDEREWGDDERAVAQALGQARVAIGKPPAPPDPAWYAKAREVLAMVCDETLPKEHGA